MRSTTPRSDRLAVKLLTMLRRRITWSQFHGGQSSSLVAGPVAVHSDPWPMPGVPGGVCQNGLRSRASGWLSARPPR